MRADRPLSPTADGCAWITIGGIALVVAGFVWLGAFAADGRSFLLPLAVAALLAAGGGYYRLIRCEARLGAMLCGTAEIVGFAAVAGPLSYLAAAAGFPLQDAVLEAWDRRLGIDWSGMVNFVALRPGLQLALLFAYSSFALQTVTTVLVLGLAGQLARLGHFIHAFMATTLVIIAISAISPAAGPWLYLDLQPGAANGFLPVSSSSWPVFLALRDGSLRTVYGLNTEGIITFPSLHAALGVLFAAALWRVKKIRWIALLLNGLLLMATPAYGSHYVTDVLAGIAVAAVSWIALAPRFDPASEPQPEQFSALEDRASIVPEAALPQSDHGSLAKV